MSTTSGVKERPIIFSGDSPRLILDDRKSQTRRAIKPQPPEGYHPHIDSHFTSGKFWNGYALWIAPNRYGKVGDRLWVRETWAQGVNSVIYRADYDVSDGFGSHVVEPKTGEAVPLIWKPSRYMPRWASRILLEITGIRAERLQEIILNDVIAEGVWSMDWVIDHTKDQEHPNWKLALISLWDQINAKRGYSWESNPWAWVIEFRRLHVEGNHNGS